VALPLIAEAFVTGDLLPALPGSQPCPICDPGTIVLTANTGFSRWKALFPSEAVAVATVDRLVDGASILRFTGKSFRTPREIVGAPLDE
jgi:hypothetical protein